MDRIELVHFEPILIACFQLERVIVKGLLGLTGELKGDYYPLHGSRSYAEKPTGMSVEKEEELRNNGNLFQVSSYVL